MENFFNSFHVVFFQQKVLSIYLSSSLSLFFFLSILIFLSLFPRLYLSLSLFFFGLFLPLSFSLSLFPLLQSLSPFLFKVDFHNQDE